MHRLAVITNLIPRKGVEFDFPHPKFQKKKKSIKNKTMKRELISLEFNLCVIRKMLGTPNPNF